MKWLLPLILCSTALGSPTVRAVWWNLHNNQNPVGQLQVLRQLQPDVCFFSEGFLADPLFISIGEDQSLDAWGIHWEGVRDRPANPAAALAECTARLEILPTGPSILGGDFNVTRCGGGYSVSTPPGSIEVMEAAGFVSVIETPTYHAGYPALQLDWIFASPEVEVLAVGTAGSAAESDHLLVWADFLIPDPPTVTMLLLGAGFFLLLRRRKT